MNRKQTDVFFKFLFKAVSLVSVLSLGAILFFVFVQGLIPFFVPTAKDVRLVSENIDELTVNGQTYKNHSGFIDLPKDSKSILIKISTESFFDEEELNEEFDEESYGSSSEESMGTENFINNKSTEKILEMIINPKEKDPEKQITFINNSGGEVSYPEAYVCSVSWPGKIAIIKEKIHIILPEPPYNPIKFLTGLTWRPIRDKLFGIFPMITGTILVSFGAILLGVPIALLCAVFMAEFLANKPAALVRSCIELLAGIPSVVYGFFGLMVIVPAVKVIFNIPAGNTLFSAILVLALMILPTVITITETSLRAVPLSLREASLSLGASKMQTSWRVVLPHARSGVIAGIILGISRAVGETMAVILVAGNSPHLTLNPLESVRTLTSTIVMEMGYASARHSEMLFSIGVVLFIIILFLNSLILSFYRRTEEA